jgi:hypothetical protein
MGLRDADCEGVGGAWSYIRIIGTSSVRFSGSTIREAVC